jgi:hypothetical protein
MSSPERAGVIMTKTIHAVWRNGQIVPTQPVDWPEGTALAVEPISEDTDLLAVPGLSVVNWAS